MPRKPKPKDGLSAGERVALYEAKQAERMAQMSGGADEEKIKDDVRQKKNGDLTTADLSAAAKISPKPAKTLQKPQHATVKVDISWEIGEIKPLHGMCNGPVSYGADLSELYREMGVPSVRFSGTDTAVSMLAVDVSRIFKDPHADPHDAKNYDFKCTDAYVTAAYNCGAKVLFRLGESFDRSGRKAVMLPTDIDAWCVVCINIIKHYNDYWANGYAFGIERFEIWGSDPLSEGDRAAEYEIYRKLSAMIKLYDSGIKIGGMCFGDNGEARDFIKFCRKTHSPLDFLTVSAFESSPLDVSSRIHELVPTLVNLGFGETEIIVGEWAYIPKNVDLSTNIANGALLENKLDSTARKELFEGQCSIKGAAYALSAMLELGTISEVGAAYLYDAQPRISPWCPICDRFGEKQKPFYAFKMFGELYRARRALYCVSEQTEGYLHTGIYAGAARAAGGEVYILISSFEGCGVVDLRLDSIPSDIYTAQTYILDGVKDFVEGDTVQLSGVKKRLLLNISEFGAVLIKLY